MRRLISVTLGLLLLGAIVAPAAPVSAAPGTYQDPFWVCWVVNPNRTPNGYEIAHYNVFTMTDSHTGVIKEFVQCAFRPIRMDLPNYGNGCVLVILEMQPGDSVWSSGFWPSPNLDQGLICPPK